MALEGGCLKWVQGKDIGKTEDDAEKYYGLVWIAPYASTMVQYFGDMYGSEGTHGISLNNWRAIPLCVNNSLGTEKAVSGSVDDDNLQPQMLANSTPKPRVARAKVALPWHKAGGGQVRC
jgi:hypothetical protein